MSQQLLYLLSLLAVVFSQHSVILQRFDFRNDQTLKKNVDLYLNINADDLAASACYELYFDAGVREVNQCVAMATHTIRDHVLAMAHGVVHNRVPGYMIAKDEDNDATTMALQYAYGSSDPAGEQSYNQRVCYVGIPPMVDFLAIIHAGSVSEFVLYLSRADLPRFTSGAEGVLEEIASSAGKYLSVIKDYLALGEDRRNRLESLQRCDIVHLQSTPAAEVATVLDAVHQDRRISDASQPRHTRIVRVRDFDMDSRLRKYPLVAVQGRLFAAHNTTADMLLAPEGSAAQDADRSAGWFVRWQMFSIWVDQARMHAISNYDGMTGRAFATSRAPSSGGAGVTQMQEVCVGELLSSSPAAAVPSSPSELMTSGGEGQRTRRVIAITYTIRVFGETAEGLKAALRSLGYRKVYVLPEVTLGALSFLRSALTEESAGGGAGEVLQIALGPHDFTMLLPRYIVFQMEQVWSGIAFAGEYRLRYGLVLSGAACILSYSPLHTDLLSRLGYARVFLVPLYSADTNRAASDRSPQRTGAAEQGDLDFLFFGGCSERRREKLEAIVTAFPACAAGDTSFPLVSRSCYRYLLNCVNWETGVFDALRHSSVQRSGIVVNIHNDESSVLEVHRINYLLSMGRCVVSERSDDLLLDAQYGRSVRFVEAGDDAAMHAAIVALLRNATDLRICQESARQHYSELMMDTKQLAAAIGVAFNTT